MFHLPTPALTRRALLTGAAAAAVVGASPARTRRKLPDGFMRGMTVSCPGYGKIWGAEPMRQSLKSLNDLGVDWTAVHPYAGVRTDGSIRHSPASETGYLDRCVRICRDEGHRLFWKPHLAYWGSFDWRGAITFADEAGWKKFFAGYRTFIVDQARFAERHRLPLFSVGIEYHKTLHRRRDWEAVIAAVREVYSGPITYAANWNEIDDVPFWGLLDAIGVQAYFPLASGPDASTSALVHAWNGPLAQLRTLSAKHRNLPVIFTEIGYARCMDAAKEPWKPDNDRSPRAIDLRSRLLAAAFTRLADEPLVRGAFWWKWIPGPGRFDRDFSMKDPEARAALRHHWAKK